MRRTVCAMGILAAVTAASACSRAPQGRAKVVTSVFPVTDLTKRVAGDDADVVMVSSASDAAQMKDARVVVEVGLGLDAWMEDLQKANAPKARVLKVGDRVPSNANEPIDPYVWLDPQRARLMTKAIAEELARGDAAHASAYRSRANDVDRDLDALDHEIEAKAAAWSGKPVAFHGATVPGAFACFAERYKIDVAGPGKAGAVSATLDPLGGTPETNSYVALVRFDAAALDRAMH